MLQTWEQEELDRLRREQCPGVWEQPYAPSPEPPDRWEPEPSEPPPENPRRVIEIDLM